jgi:hypothetical protein
MAQVRSNLAEVRSSLSGLASAFSLARYRSSGKSLGEEALDLIARNIQERSLGEQAAPDNTRWAENKEPYASSRKKAGKQVGVLTGKMLSLPEIQGIQTIDPDAASMTYGRTPEAQQEAEWFQDPKEGRSQKPREFYEFDERGERDLDALFDGAAEERIRELGGE